MDFVVNKATLLVGGVEKVYGNIVTDEDLGKQWRSLLSRGWVRRIGQPVKSAYWSGERFKLDSKVDFT